MKSFFLLVAISSFIAIGIGVSAKAASTGDVTATVTVQNIQLTLSQTTFDYGTMAANTASSTIGLWAVAGVVVTNTGNIAEDFDINGANTGSWAISTATASDVYVHKFCNDTALDCATPETNYTALAAGTSVLSAGVATSGTIAFQLSLTTPNPGTVFTEQSAPVTVTASAA